MADDLALTGRCTCLAIRYRLTARPMFVHCCHCRWCQREAGSAFVLNALVETERIALDTAGPEVVDTPSNSGKGQLIQRCPTCRVALWSHYGRITTVAFVRVGTLDNPDLCPPDIHIFTRSKQPWVVLPEWGRVVTEYYEPAEVWPAESLARRAAARRAAGLDT